MFYLSSLTFLLSTLAFSSVAGAFNNSYECTSRVETTVGYFPLSDKIEFNADRVKNPATVSLSGVKTDTPVLHAQQNASFVKLLERESVISFAETTSGGTIVIWTLFEKDESRPPTLISTKSYNLFGAASFTALYQCK